MVTLGTGVGGGIIIDGKLYTGCNGIAGELGHIVIRRDGEPCNCGRKGCLEAYASAASFVKFAERALAAGRESMLQENAGHLNAKMICDAVDAAMRSHASCLTNIVSTCRSAWQTLLTFSSRRALCWAAAWRAMVRNCSSRCGA